MSMSGKEAAKAEAKAHKERIKEEAKLNKHKQTFLDTGAAQNKRVQAFLEYCDRETDTAIVNTIREHNQRFFFLIAEVIVYSDNMARKGLFSAHTANFQNEEKDTKKRKNKLQLIYREALQGGRCPLLYQLPAQGHPRHA